MADKKISALTGATTPLAGTEVLPIVQSGATVKVAVSDLTAGRAVATGALTTTGTLTATGQATLTAINQIALLTGSSTASAGSSTGVALLTGTGKLAWLVGAQYNVDQVLEITPSTANGGTTFSTPAVTVNGSTGNVGVQTGNLVIGTSGKGIDFSATAGTGTSELLADYEEGTWTPVDQSGAGLTFTSIEATYTKVGRQITCNASFSYPVTASGATAVIGGLPFNSGSYGPASIQGFFSATTATLVSRGVYGGAGVSRVNIDKNNATATATNLDMSNALVYFTIVYQV
jgi:hypothetical protein